ncbi:beta-1,3-galactosyltransferase 1-like [Haliotis asinina]|uniref:beta-1,3-galactosyltransferase 1-like n=1 Tax=Haliotis asinina TaxID=109174 RepID=UPI00353206E5
MTRLYRHRYMIVVVVAIVTISLVVIRHSVHNGQLRKHGSSPNPVIKGQGQLKIGQGQSLSFGRLHSDELNYPTSKVIKGKEGIENRINKTLHEILQNRLPSGFKDDILNKTRGNIKSTFRHMLALQLPDKDPEAWHNNVSDSVWFDYFTPTTSVTNPHKFEFLLSAKSMCDNVQEIDVVVTIHSRHQNRKRRDVIRSTWGGEARRGLWMNESLPGTARVVFLFGKSRNNTENILLEKENKIHGDIVQEDFTDVYRNLTLKSLMGLRWVAQYCSSAFYMLKTDDDVFVHLSRLIRFVKKLRFNQAPEKYIYGRQNYPIPALRSGHWGVDRKLYPFKRFPKYVSGGGYLLPVSMAHPLFNISKYFPQFPLEDVGVTGVLRKALGYQLQYLPALIERRYRHHSAVCDMARITDYVLIHAVDPSLMQGIYNTLAINGTGCPENVRVFQQLRRYLGKDLPLRIV